MGKRGARRGEPQVQVAEFALAILQRTRSYSNWFWALNGADRRRLFPFFLSPPPFNERRDLQRRRRIHAPC
jgi:hypothetical protein